MNPKSKNQMNTMKTIKQKIERQAELLEFEREAQRVDQAFYRLPTWMQATLEGDRLSDGSDEQEY